MKTRIFITILLLCALSAKARKQEEADSLANELQEIVVTARQPATRLVGSTLVTTVAGSGLADLGTALDVLAQLPMIKVQDNSVSVIGRNNIEIYIDGRPIRDENELQQILSTNIRKVELMMAPGAAYESTTGAVLGQPGYDRWRAACGVRRFQPVGISVLPDTFLEGFPLRAHLRKATVYPANR